MLIAADAGAEDVRDNGDSWEVLTPPGELAAVRSAIESNGWPVTSSELTMQPTQSVPIESEERRPQGAPADRPARRARRRTKRLVELRHPRLGNGARRGLGARKTAG